MKDRKNKGVTLITLSIAIIIIIIIVGTLVYNFQNGLETKRLKNMYTDIAVLQDKVSEWYTRYGEIPGEIYDNTEKILTIKTAKQLNINDGDIYYKIDVQAFDNLTLNYGKGYDDQNSEDVYIINEQSHRIYYIKGIKSGNIIYYTNEKPDENNINLLSDINIKLYKIVGEERQHYKAGAWTNTDIEAEVMYQNNNQSEKEFIAISKLNEIKQFREYETKKITEEGEYLVTAKIGESGLENKRLVRIDKTNPTARIELDKETTSVKGSIKAKVTHNDEISKISIEDCRWVYNEISTEIGVDPNNYTEKFSNNVQTVNLKQTTHGTYYLHVLSIDVAGNATETISNPITVTEFENIDITQTNPTAAKPNGATIIESDANKGIVIKDSKNNEWVWVEVPKSVTTSATTDDAIYSALEGYAGDYINGSKTQGLSDWKDEWYSGCGLSENDYNNAKSKMLNSIRDNGGFWISRYEIGDSTATSTWAVRTNSSGVTGIPVSKANQIPYNWITCSEAQGLANSMLVDNTKTYSLLFGIQWSLTCKFLEESGLSVADINSNSTVWGNYSDNSLILNRGRYNVEGTDSWKEYTTDTLDYVVSKITSNNKDYNQLLTTGSSEKACKMNIYDFAGNVWELTLRRAGYDRSVDVGGSYNHLGSDTPASSYSNIGHSDKYISVGARATLY